MSTEAPAPIQQPESPQAPGAWGRMWRWICRYVRIPTLLFVGLLVYLVFFGEFSAPLKAEYQHQIDSLQQCLDRQNDSLAFYQDLNRRLNCDPDLMEQVVREQYHMNRPGEDVFVFTKDDNK